MCTMCRRNDAISAGLRETLLLIRRCPRYCIIIIAAVPTLLARRASLLVPRVEPGGPEEFAGAPRALLRLACLAPLQPLRAPAVYDPAAATPRGHRRRLRPKHAPPRINHD